MINKKRAVLSICVVVYYIVIFLFCNVYNINNPYPVDINTILFFSFLIGALIVIFGFLIITGISIYIRWLTEE